MKKSILVTLVVALMAIVGASEAKAQNVIQKGTSVANVGVGLNSYWFPIAASYDYGIADNLWDANSAFTIGARAGMAFGQYWSGYFLGPSAAIHYHFVPELDTYFSLMLGAASSTHKSADGTIISTGWNFSPGAHLGARYMFTPKVGAFAEIGYGVAYLNLGASFRF